MKRLIAALAALLMALSIAACNETKPTAQQQGQALTEQAYAQQAAAVPYPVDQLKDSLERRNLRERLIRTNKPEAVGYVYLLSFGKPLGYYVVKGKVSSTQSQMTADQSVGRYCDNGSCSFATVSAPGDDGSYGANESGIFFFLSSGQMVTTNLDYVWSDSPLPLDVPRLGG